MKKDKIDWKVLSVGIVCITVLEIYALSQGINGIVLTAVIAVIAGVLGITIPTPKLYKQ